MPAVALAKAGWCHNESVTALLMAHGSRRSTSPHSPSKTGVNALTVGEVDARSASGGDYQALYFMRLSDCPISIASEMTC